MSAFKDTGGNGKGTILLTTSVLLNHVERSYPWHCIIRTDLPDNCLMSWTKRSDSVTDKAWSNFVDDFAFEKSLSEIHDMHKNNNGEYQALMKDQRTVETAKRFEGYKNISVSPNSRVAFHCHDCGMFLCYKDVVRKMDELWLALDESIPYRAKFTSHPYPIVFDFGQGYGKLACFVCKECGQKLGFVAYIFQKSYLVLAKEYIDIYNDGQRQTYMAEWRETYLDLTSFSYQDDAWRCLPLTLLVNGQPLSHLIQTGSGLTSMPYVQPASS